jgi:integrase
VEQALARQLWHDEGWVFATPAGQPINPRADYDEWKRLLRVRRAARFPAA